MLKALASTFFYARFFRRFSRLGEQERRALQQPYDEDLSGKTWLITGASGGIGATIALAANARGALVVAAARNAELLAQLRASAAQPERMLPLVVDFSQLLSVRSGIAQLKTQGLRINVLVNNVGVLLNRRVLTQEGLESSFVSNVLSHFELTEGLRAARLMDQDGAVINMTSGGMYGTPLKLEPMLASDPKQYDGMAAYAMHKRAQVALTHYWNAQGKGAPKAYAMHPGWVDTAGVKSSLPWFRATLRRFLRQPVDAADTALWLGTTRPMTGEGVWLDRVLDSEHAFDFTRNSPHSSAELAEFLRAQCARVQSPAAS